MPFWIWILVAVVTFGLSMWAAAHVKSTYRRYSQGRVASGINGAQAAMEIMRRAGIDDVDIVESQSFLGDHYDPIHKRLVLSSENFHGNSPAALGVAAHECGHAIQHKIAYTPLHWRMAAVGVTTYANQAVMWLPLLGMVTGLFAFHGPTYLMIMAIAWGIIMLFNLVTLPVEFDASKRAVAILGGMNFIRDGDEKRAVKKVLNAAALTYVAAFFTSLVYFLMYLLPLLLRR